ncbi:MAG: DUF2085 domain-containing protein [Melioribacteraceae bacterium]
MSVPFRILLFAVLALWCAGIFIEWFVGIHENFLFALPFLQKSYSLVCHQEHSKLIFFEHGVTLTCARCTGIYSGMLFISFLALFGIVKKRPEIKFLFIAAAPMAADVILYSLNVYRYSKTAAFITGLLLGSAGFLYLYAGLKNLIAELKK